MKRSQPTIEREPPKPPPAFVDPAEKVIRGFLDAADRMEGLLSEAKQQARSDVARSLMAEILRSIDRLVLSRFRLLLALMVMGSAVLVLAAALGGYWLAGAPAGVTCTDQKGGVLCWYWLPPAK